MKCVISSRLQIAFHLPDQTCKVDFIIHILQMNTFSLRRINHFMIAYKYLRSDS